MKRHVLIASGMWNQCLILTVSVVVTLAPSAVLADRIVLGEEFSASW